MSAGMVRSVLCTVGWERRVRRVEERCVEVVEGERARWRVGWSRIRRVLGGGLAGLVGLLEVDIWVRRVVIFFSMLERSEEEEEVVVEVESMSRKWKVGVREMSRPYLCVSTILSFFFTCWSTVPSGYNRVDLALLLLLHALAAGP